MDVTFRVVYANVFVDHSTIARFRQHHEQVLKSLFSVSLRLYAPSAIVEWADRERWIDESMATGRPPPSQQ